MFSLFPFLKKKSSPKQRETRPDRSASNNINITVEMLSEPEDRFRPDASAMFKALKNVETLPQIRALKRMRVQTQPPVPEAEERFISKVIRSLAFWKSAKAS